MVIKWKQKTLSDRIVVIGVGIHDDDQYLINVVRMITLYTYSLYKNTEIIEDPNQGWHLTPESAKDAAESFLQSQVHGRFMKW